MKKIVKITAGQISFSVIPWENSVNKNIQNQLFPDLVDNSEWLLNQIKLILF